MRRYVALMAVGCCLSGTAFAQEVAIPEEAPEQAANKEGAPEIAVEASEIDLANIVTSAAKGVTTVQEAPAIITILTAEEMKARGFHFIEDAVATIPGWSQATAFGAAQMQPIVRGVGQAALILNDGLSMFDGFGNAIAMNRFQPLEMIKRIEVVTGPGGVLWGANSFLGIINIISKDAADVNGLEVSANYGDGPGNKQDVRAYAMFGKTFMNGRIKLFQHVSYENWIGPVVSHPNYLAGSPTPQPIGPSIYGPAVSLDPDRSWFLMIDGKYSFGPVTLSYQMPVGSMHFEQSFNNLITPGQQWNFYNRYAQLEYKDRFWKDRLGITARGYYTQFIRNIDVQVIGQSTLFPQFTDTNGMPHLGGVHFNNPDMLVQRTGGTVDFDMNLPHGFRPLFGGEAFYESVTQGTAYFASQPGTDLSSPSSAANLPLYCPQKANGDGSYTPVSQCPRQLIDDFNRVTVALYADLQYRPIPKLTFDGGVRLQQGFGLVPYQLTPLYSAAVVWNFWSTLHFKATYATGFRAAVAQNTSTSQGGLEFAANPNLRNESSQAFQGELNARLLRNVKAIRELELRLDYAYTFLEQLIQIHSGNYDNTGRRAIHSVEAYSKMYLQGDHFLQLSYTFLHTTSTSYGYYRGAPKHILSLGGSFNVVKNYFDLNANLLVTTMYQDPNRYPSGGAPIPEGTTTAGTTDLTFDRLTPVALLQVGFRVHLLNDKMNISGQFYNVLNQRYYTQDIFYDLAPATETQPSLSPGFNFMASMSYRFGL